MSLGIKEREEKRDKKLIVEVALLVLAALLCVALVLIHLVINKSDQTYLSNDFTNINNLQNDDGNNASNDTIPTTYDENGQIIRLENTSTITYIYDYQDLCAFRDSVNAGNDYTDKTVYLMADIDMNPGKHWIDDTIGEVVFSNDAQNWVPIGDGSKNYQNVENSFGGTFNGNYHTISGLYANNVSYLNYGFFANIKPGATVKNLIMDQVYINNIASSSHQFVAAIVGANWNYDDEKIVANIINCGVKFGHIEGNNSSTGYTIVAGIIGHCDLVNIAGCYNKSNVIAIKSGESWAGGIVGDRNGNTRRKLL